MEFKDISNSDVFFYYGQNPLQLECESDLALILFQPNRSLYYDRKESAGITDMENNPSGILFSIFARFKISDAVAYRNSQVTSGMDSTKDRRIAVSQNSISFHQNKNGDLNVGVLYFLYSDYSKPKSVEFPIGGI